MNHLPEVSNKKWKQFKRGQKVMLANHFADKLQRLLRYLNRYKFV